MIRRYCLALATLLLISAAVWALLIAAGALPSSGGPANLVAIAVLIILAATVAALPKGSNQ